MNKALPYRGVELTYPEKGIFKVNGQRLKPYFERKFKSKKVVVDEYTLYSFYQHVFLIYLVVLLYK